MTTFMDVVNDGGIRIPLLQRDYAQGRTENLAVRQSFLEALEFALRDDSGTPLNLDFVYGRREDGFLEPLDGQQRLTTLFLLHWYLASRNGAQSDFREAMWDGQHARFTYLTRPSAGDFFDRLVDESLDITHLSPKGSVQSVIRDQKWFLLAWLRDPTVTGVMTMLDAIHLRFHDLHDGYQKLISASPIEFQYLPLDEFNLSDDLYIKMNARGKALTPFEIFKVQLEEFVKASFGVELFPGSQFTWAQYFSLKMDTDWTDVFWQHRQSGSKEIDNLFINFLKVHGLVRLVESNTDSSELERNVRDFLNKPISIQLLKEMNLLDRAFVESLTHLLNRLVSSQGELGRSDYYDEVSDFAEILTGQGSKGDWVKRFAYYSFLIAKVDGEVCAKAFHEWMRLVCNLVHGSEIERDDRFANALLAVRELRGFGEGDELLRRIASSPAVGGLSQQQQREERIKAGLMLTPFEWRASLERAETHLYFRGQIEFLLRFAGIYDAWNNDQAWGSKEHREFKNAFELWLERAVAIFPVERRFDNYLWERALLTKGDYLLDFKHNKNLLKDSDRDVSWKRLLRADTQTEDKEHKRDLVRDVLQELDPNDAEGSLEAIIAKGVVGDEGTKRWRTILVENPSLIAYCGKRCLRFESGNIYLLTKTQRGGHHSELSTRWLFREFERNKQLYAPLTCDYSTSYAGYREPFVWFAHNGAKIKVWGAWPRVGITMEGEIPDHLFGPWCPTDTGTPTRMPEDCRDLVLKWAEYLRRHDAGTS